MRRFNQKATMRTALFLILFFAATAAAEPQTPPVQRPYATAHDQPLDARQELVDKADDHLKYRVEFNGIANSRVPGYLYVPTAGKARYPAVLLQYGSGGNKNTNYIVALGKQFVSQGFVVLTIDIPNKGERRLKNRPNPFGGSVLETLGDYSRAVDYLLSRDEVDRNRLAYAGISWGAITGITFVAHDPRIKVMASMVGGGGFLGLVPDAPANVQAPAEQIIRQWDPVYHVPLIAPRPLLLLNVTRDQLVPRVLSDALHKAAGQGAEKLWLDTDHFFNGTDRAALGMRVVNFVRDKLDVPAD